MRMSKTWGYVRVSSVEQASEGLSLAAQTERIFAYCKFNELVIDVDDVIADEGISASTVRKRPGLMRILSEIRSCDALVFCKLDRLSRSVRDILDLVEASRKEGWQIHSIAEKIDTSSAFGRFLVTVLAALAEMERGLVGERTKEVLAHKKANGERISRHAPYGYKFDGDRVVEHGDEQHAVQIIAAWRSGLAADIACHLRASGWNYRGTPWTTRRVAKVREQMREREQAASRTGKPAPRG